MFSGAPFFGVGVVGDGSFGLTGFRRRPKSGSEFRGRRGQNFRGFRFGVGVGGANSSVDDKDDGDIVYNISITHITTF